MISTTKNKIIFIANFNVKNKIFKKNLTKYKKNVYI